MPRLRIILRLAARDLRRRRAEAVLLFVAFTAATTTLTLGLTLGGVTDQPYQQTRTATAGPDVAVNFYPAKNSSQSPDMSMLDRVLGASGVTAKSGPFPTAWTTFTGNGHSAHAQVEGRTPEAVAVDQPKPAEGHWLSGPGQVVLERSFADALGLRTGTTITLNGKAFAVVGIAVTAAIPPYPQTCTDGCEQGTTRQQGESTGQVWVAPSDAEALATPAAPLYFLAALKLADPADAYTWINTHRPPPAQGPNSDDAAQVGFNTYVDIGTQDAKVVDTVQRDMLVLSWLLGLLAIASVAVLVGGRMADQTRRVGLLKAVGATPRLVAAVLLAQYLLVALLATAAGLAAGRLAAPALTSPGSGLLGTAATPQLTVSSMVIVAAVAVGVAVLATFVPAVRAARISTVQALVAATRAPRRRPLATAISARLPVPLLIGLRIAARRPRRTLLNVASIAITASGVVAVLCAHTHLNAQQSGGTSGLDNPMTDRMNQVLLVVTVALSALAAINAIFIAWATVYDARRASALTRALGASPSQVTTGIVAAQVVPALLGGLLGVPGGIGLFTAVKRGETTVYPSPAWLAAVVVGILVAMVVLTIVPGRMGARRPVAEVLLTDAA